VDRTKRPPSRQKSREVREGQLLGKSSLDVVPRLSVLRLQLLDETLHRAVQPVEETVVVEAIVATLDLEEGTAKHRPDTQRPSCHFPGREEVRVTAFGPG